ncbi:MAG: hypothetical protein ACR2M1_01335 [Gemmatimonadaceae bacterium]
MPPIATFQSTSPSTALPDSTAPVEYIMYDGLTAIVSGEVQADDGRYIGLEIVGAEVSVKAIAAALVMGKRADGSEKIVEKQGEQVKLVDRVFRMLTVPLSGGVVSLVLISADAVITMPHEQAQATKKRKKRLSATYDDRAARKQRERDDGGELGSARADDEDRTELHFVTLPQAADPDGVPGGLADALASTFRLPFRREWLPDLFRRGTVAGLIAPFTSRGSLLGMRVNLVPTAWEGVYRETVSAAHRVARRDARSEAKRNGQGQLDA